MKKLLPILIILALITSCTGTQNEEKTDTEELPMEEPVEVEETPAVLSINGNDDAEGRQISEKLVNVLLADDIEFMTPEQRKFRYAVTDLNDDGNREYLVEFRNSYFCGSGGCTYMLLDSNFDLITRFTVSESPFIISEERTSGWRDLIIPQGSSYHVMKFDGNTYPDNPSVEPEIMLDAAAEPVRLLDEDKGDLREFTF
jgi:hypothetical protein